MSQEHEVDLTSRRAARFVSGLMVLMVVLVLAGAIAFIVAEPELWVIIVATLIAAFFGAIAVSVIVVVTTSARETRELRATGVVTVADVTQAERVDEGEDVRYVLSLTVRPHGAAPFTATHSCMKSRCHEAQLAAPTTIPVLVDAATNRWGVVHN